MKKLLSTLLVIGLLLWGLVTVYPPSRAPTGRVLQVAGKAIKATGSAIQRLGDKLITPEDGVASLPAMAGNLTFAVIKPDAVSAGHVGPIIDLIEKNGFEIVRMRKIVITPELAKRFYAVHKERPFFGNLVEFMSSGPSIVMALRRDNAIKAWRELMGATDPAKAAEGTIRKRYGTAVSRNATHGSDAPETAAYELGLFFPDLGEDPYARPQ